MESVSKPIQMNLFGNNRVIIVCNSDCMYSVGGFCQKEGSVLMLWGENECGNMDVTCDDYVSEVYGKEKVGNETIKYEW